MTNWGREINEGLSTFLAFKKAFKDDPQDNYYRFKLENDPDYQIKEADKRLPGGQQGGFLSRIFGPARTPGITPPGAIRTSYLPQMPAYESGGVVGANDVATDNLAPQEIEYLQRIGVLPPTQQSLPMPLEASIPPPSQPSGRSAATELNVFGGRARDRMGEMQGRIPAPVDTPPPSGTMLEDAVPPPSQPSGAPAHVQLNVAGSRARDRMAEMEGRIPAAIDTGPPSVPMLEAAVPAPSQPTGAGVSAQLNVMGGRARDRMAEMEGRIPAPTDTPPPGGESSSAAGRFAGRVGEALFGTTMSPEAEARNRQNGELNRLLAEKQQLESVFRQTTEVERAQIPAQIAAIDQKIAEVQKSGLPATHPAAAVDTNRMRLPGVQPRPAVVGPGGGPAPAKAPSMVEVAGANGASTPGGTGGPPTPPVGSNGPPSGVSGNGAPSPGGAGGPPRPPAGPRKALNDQTRTEAFDPTLDANDPGNVNVANAQGAVNQYGPQQPDFQAVQQQRERVIGGGAHFAKYLINADGDPKNISPRERIALNAGVGAMPAGQARDIYEAWSGGGRLTPGQSMIRYMVAKYELLAGEGKTAAANKMAFEVIQRLNLETAKNAGMAQQYLKAGNMRAGLDALTRAHDFSPDDRTFRHTADGRQGVIVDEYTGKPVAPPFAITPQLLLAMSTGLSNGEMFWNHLLERAAQRPGAPKPDKDAEGRALRNEGQRLTNEMRRKKLAGGGGGGGGASDPAWDAYLSIRKGGAPPPAARSQGSEDGGLWTDSPSPREDPE